MQFAVKHKRILCLLPFNNCRVSHQLGGNLLVCHGGCVCCHISSPSPWSSTSQNLVSSVTSRTGIGALRDRSRLAVVVAHHLLDVVQFGLQILAAALLHPIVWRLQGRHLGGYEWESANAIGLKSTINQWPTFLISFSLLYSSRASCGNRHHMTHPNYLPVVNETSTLKPYDK